MQCHNAQQAWIDSRYGGAPLAKDAAMHIAACATCERFCASHEQLDALLRADPDEAVGVGFDTRFFARLEALKATPNLQRWRWLSGAFGARMAVGVALAAVVITLLWHVPSDAVPSQDVELAMNLDVLQEDVGMLQALDALEAVEHLQQTDNDHPGPRP